MTTFTINETNEIVAFTTAEDAAANSATPFDTFSNADELAQLATGWPAERLLAVWNSVPGLTPATEIKDAGKAAKLIFKRLEKNGTKSREKPPKAEGKAKGRPQSAKGAAEKGNGRKKATAAKTAPNAKKAAKAKEGGAAREGSRMAQVVALMQRKNGATLAELMEATGWLAHSCRGFVAGALKRAGYTVESFRPEGVSAAIASPSSTDILRLPRPPGAGRGGRFCFWALFPRMVHQCQAA
jgi:hypothetical protein